MDWLTPVIGWLKSSVVFAVAICIASGLFVFTPLSSAVSKYQPWPLIIFTVTSAYIVVLGIAAAGKKIAGVVNRKHAKRRSDQRRINSLYSLSAEEKSALRWFIANNMRTIPASRLGTEVIIVANELVRRGILRSHANWFSARDQGSFTVEDWHWDYLNQNPDVLG